MKVYKIYTTINNDLTNIRLFSDESYVCFNEAVKAKEELDFNVLERFEINETLIIKEEIVNE